MRNLILNLFKTKPYIAKKIINGINTIYPNWHLSPRSMFDLLISNTQQQSEIKEINFNKTGHKPRFYNKYLFNFSRQDVPCVAGYVPYIAGNTKVVVYNFFSVNYGVRKQFAGCVHLINNGAIVDTVTFELPSYSFISIDLADKFDSKCGTTILVELFNPRIKQNHGGFDGNLRFWGLYGNNAAIVHSMALAKGIFKDHALSSFRRSYPSLNNSREYHCALISLLKTMSTNLQKTKDLESFEMPLGFNAIFTKDQDKVTEVNTVWHDAPINVKKAQKIDRSQGITIPPIPNVDVIMRFEECLRYETTVTFELFSMSGEKINIQEKNINSKTQLMLSEIFSIVDMQKGGFVIAYMPDENACMGAGYISLFYLRNSEICDNVHSHPTIISHTSQPECVRNNEYLQNQGLKFAYFPDIKTHDIFISINTFYTDVDAKLRVILENTEEHVINLKIPPIGIKIFNLADLLIKLETTAQLSGIMQLESSQHNLLANSYIVSRSGMTMAIDHFTGG